jgi:hypothetical protein
MGDVEFLGLDPDTGGDDDVLSVGPRRRMPRWAVAVGAVLVLGTASAALVAKGHHSTDPATQLLPESPASSGPRSVDPGLVGPSTVAVAVAGNQFYALAPDSITSFDLGTMQRSASMPLTPVLRADASFQLTYDVAQASIWVIPLGGRAAGTLMEFGAADLHPMRGIRLPTTLTSAAVLDGAVYLGTPGRGLLRVPRGGRSVVTALASDSAIGAIVADPDRRRLLYLTGGWPAQVRAWSPRSGLDPAAGRLDFGGANLAVVSGSIWAGGFRAGGAALVRLDPDSLQPVRSAARLAAQLGPGALIVAVGDRDFFVRSGATHGPLWCVDGRTGAVDQLWAGPAGLVAAEPGEVWVAGPTGASSLVLRGCVG